MALVLACLIAAFAWVASPYLGGAPERDLARAGRLRLTGDVAGALAAYEAALASGSDWETLGTAEVLSSRAEVGLAAGAALEADKRHDEAEAIYRRIATTAERLSLPIRIELHWRLARCRIAAGDPVGSAVEISNIHLLRARNGRPDGGLLDRMAPALSDPEDPGHALIMSRFEEEPGDRLPPPLPDQPRSTAEWRDLARRGSHAIPEILAAIESLEPHAGSTAGPEIRLIAAEVALVAAPQLERALVGYAAGEERPVSARVVAAELLCRVAEMPLWSDPAGGGETSFVKEAIDLWTAGLGLDPDEWLRRRIETLLRRDESVLDGATGHAPTVWFRAATGAPAGVDLRSWWPGVRGAAPADRLSASLGFGDSARGLVAGNVLKRYGPSSRLDRRRIHNLLTLIAPPDAVAPSAGFSDLAWPDGRTLDHTGDGVAVSNAWSRALLRSEDAPPYQVRTAAFVYRDRGTAPMFLWESIRSARVGDTIAHHDERRIEFERMPARFRPTRDHHAWHLPGDVQPPVAPDGPPDGGASFALTTTAVLRVDSNDGKNGVLTWLSPNAETAPDSSAQWFVSHHVISRMVAVDGAPRPLVLLLMAVLEPREDAATPRGVEWWREGPAHNLRRYVVEASDRSEFEKSLLFAPVYRLTVPALSLLWSEEAEKELVQVLRMPNGPATNEEVQDVYAAAFRLLRQLGRLGNDSDGNLKDIDLLDRGEPLHTQALRHRFWEAHLLGTTRTDIFTVASQRLRDTDGRELPLYVQNDLHERSLVLGAPVPDHVIEAVTRIEERRPALPGLLWIGSLLLLALLLAIRPGASANARLRPAALVVILGVVLAANHLVLGDRNFRIEAMGLIFAAIGCAVCARSVRGLHRWIAPAGFLAAAVCVLLLGQTVRLGEGPLTNGALARLTTLRNGALALGFAGLPLLSWMMIREYRLSLPRRMIRRLAAVGAILGALGVITYYVLPTLSGRGATPGSKAGLFGEFAALMGMLALAYALARKRTYPGEHELGSGRGGKRWPRPIRALGSPPALLIGLAGAIVLTNGCRNFMFREDWLGASPGLWLVMGTMLFCLFMSANRASNVPSPWERVARLFDSMFR